MAAPLTLVQTHSPENQKVCR